MSTPARVRDPLTRQVAKTRVVVWACALVVLGAISVRWWPMGDGVPPRGPDALKAEPKSGTGENKRPQPRPRLDLAAFDCAMWLLPVAPEPVKVAAEKPTPPSPPLTLQLLGLVNEDGTTKAVLYDSAADRVRVVGLGDSIGDRKIERIDSQGVAIRDGTGLRTLALKGGGAP